MASIAARLARSGTSKSGRPIEKLIGSFILAARSKTLRMPEASTPRARAETKSAGLRMGPMSADHFFFGAALAAGAAAPFAPAAGAAPLAPAAGAAAFAPAAPLAPVVAPL